MYTQGLGASEKNKKNKYYPEYSFFGGGFRTHIAKASNTLFRPVIFSVFIQKYI